MSIYFKFIGCSVCAHSENVFLQIVERLHRNLNLTFFDCIDSVIAEEIYIRRPYESAKKTINSFNLCTEVLQKQLIEYSIETFS